MSASKLTAALATVAACLAGTAEAAPSWNVTIPQFASVAMAASATGPHTVVAPIADNGSGAAILRTTDGGKTFEKLANGQIGGMYLGGAASGNAAVASSMFSLVYNNEAASGSYNFTNSKGVLGVTSQSVEAFADDSNSFGATGSTVIGAGNGVAVTSDGGATFAWHNVSELVTSARYGAFPSASTWFLSAGQWPENEAQRDGLALSQRLTLRAGEGFGQVALEPKVVRSEATNSTTGFVAQIVKTEDAGKTWTSQFSATGAQYFNQITCASETSCVAVAEGDFVSIFTTTDGTKWTETFHAPNAQDSLMSARFASSTEVWVGGLLDGKGAFLHSSDAGKTWTVQQAASTDGIYPVSLTFVSPSEGYGTAVTQEQISAFLTLA